jgi:hypothetical protein
MFRDFLGTSRDRVTTQQAAADAGNTGAAQAAQVVPEEATGPDPAVIRAVLANKPRFAGLGTTGQPQAATVSPPLGGGPNQINVTQCCPGQQGCAAPPCNHPILQGIAAKLGRMCSPVQVEQHVLTAEGDLGLVPVPPPSIVPALVPAIPQGNGGVAGQIVDPTKTTLKGTPGAPQPTSPAK